MYIPKRYNVTDFNEIKDFIEQNSFGIIVTNNGHKPIATHVPFVLYNDGDEYFLSTHFAIGNEQWKTIEESRNENILVIFPGPHTYITSSWYERENVPTWNYQAVHVYGKATIMDEKELAEDLSRLLNKYEGHRENPVLWETLSDKTKQMMNAVVGIKVKIEEIEAAYKLSQNRNERDFQNIIDMLQLQKDENAHKIASEMKRLKK